MRERALQFGEAGNLVGVVTEPSPEDAGDLPGIILLNAGILHRIGPSRMSVNLARGLAKEGFTCIRFDFSGIGDSLPRPDQLPFEESSILEIRDAMDHLEESRDIDEFILVGLCSGADAAHRGAVADPRVVGMVPIDGYAFRTWRYYTHRYLPKLLRWKSWKNLLTGRTYLGPWVRKILGGSPSGGQDDVSESRPVFQRPRPPKERVEGDLRDLVDRGVEMLVVFSGDMDDQYNHESQYRDSFASIDFRKRLRVEYFEEADHTFTDLDRLDDLVSTVVAWACWTWKPRERVAEPAASSPGDRAA